jgi:hypothetical protein
MEDTRGGVREEWIWDVTVICCRGCLENWHGIPKRHALTADEKAYILSVLLRWLIAQEGT